MAAGLGIQDDADLALLPDLNGLGHMPPRPAEPEAFQKPLKSRALGTLGCELDESGVADGDRRRQRRQARRDLRFCPSHIIHQRDDRPVTIPRDCLRRPTTELIVENLKADRPIITCRHDRAHERGDIEVPLARHVAEVTRPVEQVHVDLRRIGQLDKEDTVAGDTPDGVRVDSPAERVKAVEDQAHIRVVGAAHHLPGITVIVDVAPPCQGLVADPQVP